MVRYFEWLGNVHHRRLRYRVALDAARQATCSGHAIGSTLQLVTAATILSLVIGVTVGIVSALRQYSGFDYSDHLPVVPALLAALLLGRGPAQAVGRDRLQRLPQGPRDRLVGDRRHRGGRGRCSGRSPSAGDPHAGWQASGSPPRRRSRCSPTCSSPAGGATRRSARILLRDPRRRSAVAIAALFAGLHNRRALYTALTTVGVGLALYLPMQVVFDSIDANNWIIFGLALARHGGRVSSSAGSTAGRTGAVSARTGAAVGVHHRRAHLRRPGHAGLAALLQAPLSGRPIPTFGAAPRDWGATSGSRARHVHPPAAADRDARC